jgi:hypothetical protein
MTLVMRLIRCPISAAVLALCSVITVAGAAQPNLEFARAQQANQAALREYTWKSRTELTLKGESKHVRLEQVRYDFDGNLQKTLIGGSPAQPEHSARGRLGGPIRELVGARKKEAFKDLMEDLATLAASYANLSQSSLQLFARQATVSNANSGESGTVRLHGRNVLAADDSMSAWINPTSHMMRRVEIDTALDMKPVHLAADYRSLGNGLTYQARAVLRYPSKEMQLTVESFEFQYVGTTR